MAADRGEPHDETADRSGSFDRVFYRRRCDCTRLLRLEAGLDAMRAHERCDEWQHNCDHL